jgi:sugar phosphate isomerase/epimerase
VTSPTPTRRCVLRAAASAASAAASGLGLVAHLAAAQPPAFKLRHVLATSLLGASPLPDLLPLATRVGDDRLDLWPRPHANHREQLAEMGTPRYLELLAGHRVTTASISRFDLGALRLTEELPTAKALNARLLIAAAPGPKGLRGDELRAAVRAFAQQLKPHATAAAEHHVTLAIENHSNTLLDTADGVRWFLEACPDPAVGIALAPYHLPQEPEPLAALVRELGPRLAHFYAWQHGKGSTGQLTPDEQLLQLPGRGPLDFKPILAALRAIAYDRLTSVFMHPIPRGVAIRESPQAVAQELARARAHLDAALSA